MILKSLNTSESFLFKNRWDLRGDGEIRNVGILDFVGVTNTPENGLDGDVMAIGDEDISVFGGMSKSNFLLFFPKYWGVSNPVKIGTFLVGVSGLLERDWNFDVKEIPFISEGICISLTRVALVGVLNISLDAGGK